MILSPNQSVIDLLYAEKSESSVDTKTIQIDDLDESQQEILKSSSQNNLVIQGPPGTGKSHTIVSMISKINMTSVNITSYKSPSVEVSSYFA